MVSLRQATLPEQAKKLSYLSSEIEWEAHVHLKSHFQGSPCDVTSCPKSSTILDNRVLAALVRSGVPAFLPPSGTLSPQESPAR
jgi:hypothetical protein